MEAKIVALPGDGIGPEVVNATLALLRAIGDKFGHDFEVMILPFGGNAIDATGNPLPEETLAACMAADAVLLGAVGGPRWDGPTATVRPEQGLLGLRKAMGLFANLRPIVPHPALMDASPLKPERLVEVNLLVFRELTGGIYFGEPRERRKVDGEWRAVDTMVYRESEIRRIAEPAFEAARSRRGLLTSVDKANILETSRLWRQTVQETAKDYPDVMLEHVLVDAMAMHLLNRPAHFDVVVTANLFGDILTDEVSMLTGSLGNLPSASLGSRRNRLDFPSGLYEPIHGSAPDIAGKGIANPIGMMLSLAMLLRHSLGLAAEAAAVEGAVERALAEGARTADIASAGGKKVGTTGMQERVIACLKSD